MDSPVDLLCTSRILVICHRLCKTPNKTDFVAVPPDPNFFPGFKSSARAIDRLSSTASLITLFKPSYGPNTNGADST